MTEQTTHHPLAESLSALMDDQASELELQRLLKASESDEELKVIWSRYQLTSAAMRKDLPAMADSDFAARLSAAIADEDVLQVAPAKPVRATHWWQNAGRFAVAASVAGAVIIGVQQFDTGSAPGVGGVPAVAETDRTERSEISPALSLPVGYQAPSLSARTVSAQSGYEPRQHQQESRQVIFVPRQSNTQQVSPEQIRDYLNQLIEEHADHASLNSGQGMLPFARVVMADDEQPQDSQEQ